MKVWKPEYYHRFRCIAGACPDSCCKEWSVQVDPESAAYYRTLPGELGHRLRQVLIREDGDTVLRIENGRCPMWRSDGLCRIQAQLGEAALCDVCREFPRLRHDFGDFLELGLELSCPEAARLILESDGQGVWEEVPGGETPEYDPEAMALLEKSREYALDLLADESRSVPQALALLLLYGSHVQGDLDFGEESDFDPDSAMETADLMAKPGDTQEIANFFRNLELLSQQWGDGLCRQAEGPWLPQYRNIARYFVRRYWLQAVSDRDLYGRVKFIVLSCLVIRMAGGGLLESAQRYSKEIENNYDNVEAILEGAYTHRALTDDKILGLLLGSQEGECP